MFEVSETLLVRGVRGFEPDGVTPSSQDIVLYVVSKSTSENYLEAVSPNGKTVDGFTNCIPTIPTGTMLVRMGRAAGELDVQTAQFEALPVKCQNYCQIFKMQIEQSTLQKIANKEVLRLGRGCHLRHASGHGEKLPFRCQGPCGGPDQA